MPTLQEQLDAAVARATTDSGLFHAIVHGDAATSVDTEGGPVPSVAKAIAGVEAAVAAGMGELTVAVAAGEAARDGAEDARDGAVAARDQALAAAGAVKVTAADTNSAPLAAKLAAGLGFDATVSEAGGVETMVLGVERGIDAAAQLFLALTFV